MGCRRLLRGAGQRSTKEGGEILDLYLMGLMFFLIAGRGKANGKELLLLSAQHLLK